MGPSPLCAVPWHAVKEEQVASHFIPSSTMRPRVQRSSNNSSCLYMLGVDPCAEAASAATLIISEKIDSIMNSDMGRCSRASVDFINPVERYSLRRNEEGMVDPSLLVARWYHILGHG